MRQLHVVALSDDGSSVLLAASPDAARPSHRLPVDDRLRAALRGALPPPGRQSVESALSPKEIQARLRAGATPEEVARVAGVPVNRILRYAGPVLSERDRVIEEAREAHLSKPRLGRSELALGDAVEAHLVGLAGFKRESVEWTARRAEDGSWVVAVSFSARGGRRTATWRWRPADRSVQPLDALGTRMGYGDPQPAAPRPAPRKAPRKVAKKAVKAAAKPAAKAPRKAAKKTPATKKATPAKKTATTAAPAKRAAAKRAVAAKRAKPAKKPTVPTWSEVLLGTAANRPRGRRPTP